MPSTPALCVSMSLRSPSTSEVNGLFSLRKGVVCRDNSVSRRWGVEFLGSNFIVDMRHATWGVKPTSIPTTPQQQRRKRMSVPAHTGIPLNNLSTSARGGSFNDGGASGEYWTLHHVLTPSL